MALAPLHTSDREERLAPILTGAFGIDVRALAAFRIGLGTVLLADLALRAQHLVAHYTDIGALPLAALRALSDRPILSLHALSGDAWVQALLFSIAVLAAIGLLVGYRTRWMTVISWGLLASLHARNPYLINTGDNILLLLLLWGILLPLGARWSVDAARARKPNEEEPRPTVVTTLATMGLLLQVCMVYFLSVFYKTSSVWWGGFTAIYYTLNLHTYLTPLGDLLAAAPLPFLQVLTASTLLLEALGPILVLLPLWNGWLRTAVVFAFVGFHAGLAATLNLGPFPFVCMVAWIPFLPPVFWDTLLSARSTSAIRSRLGPVLSRLVTRSRARPAPAPSLTLGAAGTIMALLLIWGFSLQAWHRMDMTLTYTIGRPVIEVDRMLRATGVEQHWDMFAPRPPSRNYWYGFTGVTPGDSAHVSVFPESGLEPSADTASYVRPSNVGDLPYRWRRFLGQYVRNRKSQPQIETVPAYLWNRWHAEHPDRPLERIEVELFVEETPPPGEPSQEAMREVLLEYRPTNP